MKKFCGVFAILIYVRGYYFLYKFIILENEGRSYGLGKRKYDV